MPSRRILSNSNLSPIQEAAVNPYDSFNSDVINKLTRIVSGGKDIDVVVDGLDISSFSDRKWYAFTESLLPNISNSVDWIVSKDSHNNNNAIIYYRTDAASEIDSGDIDFFIDHVDSYGTSYIETFVKDIPNSSVTKSIFEPLYESTQSKDFEISFRLKWGTPKLIVVAIDETKIEIDHPKASNDLYTFRLTKYFRQKKIGEKLRFRFSVVLDAADPDSEMAKSSTNKTYVRIRDISCKLLGFSLPEPNRSIGPVEEIYNFNGINPTHSIRVTPGIALKDDVMLEELAKDINKDVSIDLPLTTGNNAVNSKIWIKNDPYTKSDFGFNYVYQLNNNLVEYKKFSASINSTTGRLVASVNGYNVYPSAQKELTYNTSGSIQDTLIGTAASAVLSENNKKLVITFTKPSAVISDYNKNYGNHCLITYNDRVVDDVVININSSGVIAENIVATINTELVNDPHETNLKNRFKAYLALGPIKVSGDKLYYTPASVKWAYVVLYYAYFKNPVPNVSYIGLVRESEIDNFREDYVILAKVRFIDPVTVDIISYENRQAKKLPHSDNINYSETCNDPEIWPQEVPVTVTDAINYLAKFDVDISRFVRYKHDYDAEISTAFNLVRKDAASLDTTPYININEDNHLERRIKINSNVIIVSDLVGEFSYLSLPTKGTRFTKNGSYYTASGSSWAITNNQTIIKQNLKDLDEKFNVRTTYVMGIKNGDTFSPMFICFNNVGPFKFVNISDGEHVITFDWLYLGHSLLYPTAPFITTDNSGNWTDTDKGTINGSGTAQKYVDNETNGRYILSYDDVTVEGDTEGVPSGENHLNGQENHFKYLVFRSKSLNSSKFLRLLDILPKKSLAKNKSGSAVEESLIEGRVLYGTNVATNFAGNQVHAESSQHYIDDNPIHGNLMITEKASTRNTVAGKTTEVRNDNNSDTLISGHYSIPNYASESMPRNSSSTSYSPVDDVNYNYGSKNGVSSPYYLSDNAVLTAKKRDDNTIDIISTKYKLTPQGENKIIVTNFDSTDKLENINSHNYTPGDYVGHWFIPKVEYRLGADEEDKQVILIMDTVHNFIIRTSQVISALDTLKTSVPYIKNNTTKSMNLKDMFNSDMSSDKGTQRAFTCYVILDLTIANSITDNDYIDDNYYDYNNGVYSKNGYQVVDLYCHNKLIFINDMTTAVDGTVTYRPYIQFKFDYWNNKSSYFTVGGKQYIKSNFMNNNGEFDANAITSEDSGFTWNDIYRGYDNKLLDETDISSTLSRHELYPIVLDREGKNTLAMEYSANRSSSADITMFRNSGNGYCRGPLVYVYAGTKAEYTFMHIRNTPDVTSYSGLNFNISKTKKFIFGDAKYYSMMKY